MCGVNQAIQFDAGPSTKKTPGHGSDVLEEGCHLVLCCFHMHILGTGPRGSAPSRPRVATASVLV